MKNRVGQQLGNYRLVRSLGRGGFAEVYLGEHLYLKNYAALKVLHTQLADKDIDQFLTEAQTLAHLTHPNIVRVLEFAVEQEGTAFLVTEYVPRGTLRKRHPRGSCLSLETIASYVTQIASALQYAHNQKLIHRDVKPENVLLGFGQNVLLSDFGLSLFSPSDRTLEVPGLAGTLPYMAPELFQRRPEFASDQYALGIMAYEWLCGKRPFQGGFVAIQYGHMHVPPPSLRDHDPSLSQEIEDVVLKALAKDPKQRYGSMQLFAQAFGQACQASQTSFYADKATAALDLNHALTSITPLRIFISSAPDDEAFATRLTKDLQMRGMAARNDLPGEATGRSGQGEEVRRAIRAADLVLLVVSTATQSSSLVRNHLNIVSQYQRRLLCIQTADTGPSPILPQGWLETTQLNVVYTHNQPYERILDELLAYLEHDGAEEKPILSELVGEPRSPYKGLRAFTQTDVSDFFGRDHLIEELVNQVQELTQLDGVQKRLLAVIGPSGSGKSSVVMAGLLPRLQQGASLESKNWVYLRAMVPGTHPLEALALTLAPHLPAGSMQHLREELMHEAAYGLHQLASQVVRERGQKVVLFVDQFEEVFTLPASEGERQHFINLLVTAATEAHGPVIVLLTLRADFYHRCMVYPRLHRLIEKHQKSVLPLETAELRTIIKGPAALPDVQVAFEGNLVSELLVQVQEQAGALPLLQFTLEQLFLRRKGRLLTLQAYREIGGVKGALVQHAEAVYTALPSEEHRHLARTLFLRLIDPGLSKQDTTRRRAAIPELLLPDSRQTALLYQTADSFITARLLTTDEISGTTTIEISHEALIREWPRLAEWLRSARNDIRLQQTISADVAEWQKRDRPDDLLYRGSVLAEAEDWMRHQTASANEVEFIRTSATKQQKEETADRVRQARELLLQHRSTNRLRILVTVLSIFLVVAVVLSSVAVVSGLEAQKQAELAREQADLAKKQVQIALSRTLVKEAESASSQNHRDRALLLAAQAYQTDNSYQTRNTLLNVLLSSSRLETVFHQGAPLELYTLGQPSGLVFGAGDRTLITSNAQDDGQIAVWDIKSRSRHFLTTPPFRTHRQILNLAISLDSRTLAASVLDSSGPSDVIFIELWDLTTGKSLTRLNTQVLPRSIYDQRLRSLTFSPDGKTLAFGGCEQESSSANSKYCVQGQVLLFDVGSGELIDSPLVTPGEVSSVDFSPDGTRLAVATCIRHDPDDLQTCLESQVLQWDAATRKPLPPLLTDKTGFVLHTMFSPDGKYIASERGNDSIALWDAVTGVQVNQLVVSPHSVTSLAFSPDSTVLASGSEDGTVSLWDVSSGELLDTLTGHASQVSQVAFSHDGRQLATASEDSIVLLWNLSASTPISRHFDQPNPNAYLMGPNGNLQFSPDGKLLVVSNYDQGITLWDVATGQVVATLAGTRNFRFSPDGKLLAAATSRGIILWEVAAKKAITTLSAPEYQDTHMELSFSADSKTLASMESGLIILWDIATGKRVGRPFEDTSEGDGPFENSLAFSSKDANVLASSRKGLFAFSPDGRFLAYSDTTKLWNTTTGASQQLPNPPDGTTILWNVKEGKQVAPPLSSRVYRNGLAFSPDSQTLAIIDTLWSTSTGELLPQSLTVPFIPGSGETEGIPTPPTVAFSSDGALIALEAAGGRITLWDGKTYTPLVQALPPFNGSPVFSPDGHWLASADGDGITLWNIHLPAWETTACTIANRNLTQSEWEQFSTGEPYRQICKQFPVHPSVIIKNLPRTVFAEDVYRDGPKDVKDHATASAAFKQATQLSLKSDDPLLSDMVCWFGATEGFAREVLPACDHAVKLAPDNGNYYDSRGLARAVGGNSDGAIQDFEYFVKWAKTTGLYTTTTRESCDETEVCKTYIQEREDWIEALKAFKLGGNAPFQDTQELLALQMEKSYDSSIWMTYPEHGRS